MTDSKKRYTYEQIIDFLKQTAAPRREMAIGEGPKLETGGGSLSRRGEPA